jgi:hypothetical protein
MLLWLVLDLAGIANIDGQHLHAERRAAARLHPNWPGPAANADSRRTAVRVTWGAISLSSSSHSRPSNISKLVKPVTFAAGARQAFDVAAANRVGDQREYDWDPSGSLAAAVPTAALLNGRG